MNTVKDLKKIVHAKMYETIDGRMVDQYEQGKVEIPHMLGITEMGETCLYEDYEGTILDPSHEFWDDYVEDVSTIHATEDAVEFVIHVLNESGDFNVYFPHGEEADIVYTEVEEP